MFLRGTHPYNHIFHAIIDARPVHLSAHKQSLKFRGLILTHGRKGTALAGLCRAAGFICFLDDALVPKLLDVVLRTVHVILILLFQRIQSSLVFSIRKLTICAGLVQFRKLLIPSFQIFLKLCTNQIVHRHFVDHLLPVICNLVKYLFRTTGQSIERI